MFISDQEKENRLGSGLRLSGNQLQVESHHFRGRTPGTKNLPAFMRPIIGAAGVLSGHKKTAEEFGVSKHVVSIYARGQAPNAAGELPVDRPELKNKVDELVGRAQEKAAERLMSALGFITDDKLENVKARDLSGIAADMSRIIEKTSPKSGNSGGTNIVIYAPNQKSEEAYEVIEVKRNNAS